MGIMKSFVCNRNSPEGSITERCITIECLTFCSGYLVDTKTNFNIGINNGNNVSVDDLTFVLGIFHSVGRLLGGAQTRN